MYIFHELASLKRQTKKLTESYAALMNHGAQTVTKSFSDTNKISIVLHNREYTLMKLIGTKSGPHTVIFTHELLCQTILRENHELNIFMSESNDSTNCHSQTMSGLLNLVSTT
jgi:hypothetical protein